RPGACPEIRAHRAVLHPALVRRRHVLEEVDVADPGPVSHRRVDVEDRVVRAVVACPDAVDTQRDRLHQGLALQRARDAAATHAPRRRCPCGADDAANRWVLEHRHADDLVTFARDPATILMHTWLPEPAHRALERLLDDRQGRRHVLRRLLIHSPDLAVLVGIVLAIEREQLDALGAHAVAALSGHALDALAVLLEIEHPATAAAILAKPATGDRGDAQGVILVRAHGDALRTLGTQPALHLGEQHLQRREIALVWQHVTVDLAVRHLQ